MTSKQDLIQFTHSFPGADAQILGRMTNSYITGDTIEYKTITLQDSSIHHRDVNITNDNGMVNINGSLNVVEDIKCQTANINNVFALDVHCNGVITAGLLSANTVVSNELIEANVLVANDISATGAIAYSKLNLSTSIGLTT